MSSWGNYDNAANAPYWAVNSTIAPDNSNRAMPTAANVALLYGNTTPNVYTTDETLGLFMVDKNEEDVLETNDNPAAHTGWNIRKEGSGGRAGRVQWETLVAIADVKSDNDADDATLPDTIITFTSQPQTSNSVIANGTHSVTFNATAAATAGDTGASISYQWQVNAGGASWVDMVNGSSGQPGGMTNKAGVTTNTLVLTPTNTTANNYVFRLKAYNASAGATTYSANGQIVIF